MIQQTLEWHRMKDDEPNIGALCLVLRDTLRYQQDYEPQRAVLCDASEGAMLSYFSGRPIRWSMWRGFKDCNPDDLWAYWSEPKEKGK